MSFDEEWSAARATATASVAMRLNQLAPEPGGGGGSGAGGDLELNQDHIGAIGSEAYKLHSRLLTDGRHAATATIEAAGALTREGFASGAALSTAQTTWESQVKTLLAACANVSNALNYSLSAHAKDEQQLRADLTASALTTHLT
ncbi:hypothetical protein [Streptomyces subrutilus]|uniref:Uncharacterized protein n=1 Tax=Streptomyces subrutilus TaxID=36818 RepID=A0A5P2UMR3_9ACTN|nr:hypothetical protein [Streptomyces subrutilus]QEU80393.1 hypothetical protein CP968_20685 [Streptomyces subrutilus]WSJ30314.1 hypothetical protein OG479_13955 [Streptomyces subrutilus]GGZ75927.1 hypothetical protein GCM10010371_39670 [Streptomyces subrutilus]